MVGSPGILAPVQARLNAVVAKSNVKCPAHESFQSKAGTPLLVSISCSGRKRTALVLLIGLELCVRDGDLHCLTSGTVPSRISPVVPPDCVFPNM